MPRKPGPLFNRMRAWFRYRSLRVQSTKKRQRLQAAVLLPTLALFTALGILMNDSFFTETQAPAPSAMPSGVVSGAGVSPVPAKTVSSSVSPYDTMGEIRVWIPQGGTRYHKTPDCSGMKDPTEIPLREAKERGFIPCKRCDPPE